MRKVGRLRWIAASVVVLVGCGEPDTEIDFPVATLPGDSTTTYLRQPVLLPDSITTGRLTFAETVYDFGRVRAGRTIRHRFSFTNSGPGPLRISAITGSCGCTVSRYPTEPIDSGSRSVIEVIFSTRGTEGRQYRPIVVRANSVPAQTTLYLSGEVIP